MQYSNVTAFLGQLLIYLAIAMLIPLGTAVYMGEGDASAFGLSAAICLVAGGLLRGRRRVDELSARDAFAIVTFGWLLVAMAGGLPMFFSRAVPTYIDAFFEAVSGVTTTGATVITNIESVPHGTLLWRALLQWLGGLGFIVLSLAVLPKLAVGGMELFKAEVPTPIPERVTPRLKDTSRVLWNIYIALTLLLALLLWLVGFRGFDAMVHALATLPSGGFGIRSTSIAAYGNLPAEFIITIFMFLAGANFTLYYRAFHSRDLREIVRDTEFRVYVCILGIATLLVASSLWTTKTYALPAALRQAGFQVVSIMTTTGFASADFNQWPPLATGVLVLLMFIGGSAGSTAGGIKVLRHVVAAKHGYREVFRLIHPRLVRPVRVGQQAISESIIASVLSFVLLYAALFGLGTLLIAAHGEDFKTSVTAAAAAIGNVGPGLGLIGPMQNYAFMSPTAKLILCGLMLIGRLEIYTVLVLLLPRTWARSRRESA